ncbi:MAG: DUF502 domain-containing protein [Pirellulales bacterium]|nr:DUF502 domain-containing protein [Pirellulales bacterium]
MADPHAPRHILRKPRKFRGAVLRGLTLLLPPILTIVILLWAATTIDAYLLAPIQAAARETLAWTIGDVRSLPRGEDPTKITITIDGHPYVRLASGQYVPRDVVAWLREYVPSLPLPANGAEVYRRYVESRFLKPQYVVPAFLGLFVLVLYFLGKFLAGEIGRLFDWGILRLPMVRKVYGSVKQVTDFVFGEQTHVEFKRVVVIEYPRKGLWSIGLVTGEGMLDVSAAANEPCVSIVLPTSPAIFTVKTVMVPKSKTYDVKMTIDQALQFVISCGVVVPPHQLPSLLIDKTPTTAESEPRPS